MRGKLGDGEALRVGGCSCEGGDAVCAMDNEFAGSPMRSLPIHIHLSSLTGWPTGLLARGMERRWGAKDRRVIERVGRWRQTASKRWAPPCMGTDSWGGQAWNETLFLKIHCFSRRNKWDTGFRDILNHLDDVLSEAGNGVLPLCPLGTKKRKP